MDFIALQAPFQQSRNFPGKRHSSYLFSYTGSFNPETEPGLPHGRQILPPRAIRDPPIRYVNEFST